MLLENSKLRVELDGSARIISLTDKKTGVNIIDSPAEDGFFLNLADSRCKENLAFGHDQTLTASQNGDTISFCTDRLKLDCGRTDELYVDFGLTLNVTLDGEDIIFTAELDDRAGMRVLDFEYPRVGIIKSLGDGKPSLYWPEQPGRIYHNIGERLTRQWTHR